MGSDIFLSLILVLLNGFFVAAEFAIVKVRSSQLELRARSGSFLARITQNITANLNAYLSATQLGITLASLGLGWYAERLTASVAAALSSMAGMALSEQAIHALALPLAFGAITVLHIVLGELVPKALALGDGPSCQQCIGSCRHTRRRRRGSAFAGRVAVPS